MKSAKIMKISKKQLDASGIAYNDHGRFLSMRIHGMQCFLTPYDGYLEFAAVYPSALDGGRSDRNKAYLFDLTGSVLSGKFEIKDVSDRLCPAFQATFPAEFIDKPKKLMEVIGLVLSTASSYKDRIRKISEAEDRRLIRICRLSEPIMAGRSPAKTFCLFARHT